MSKGKNFGIRIPGPGEASPHVRKAFQQIVDYLGYESSPSFSELTVSGSATFGSITAGSASFSSITVSGDVTVGNNLTLSNLTANRLTATNGSKVVVSTDLASWAAGTSNQVIVTDDADGTITLSLPQNIHTGASPTFVAATLSSLTASRLMASDGSKLTVSTDLSSWVAGTTNQITVTDDADGTITLSLPQDIHTGAGPQFDTLSLGAAAVGTQILQVHGDTDTNDGAARLLLDDNSSSANRRNWQIVNGQVAYGALAFYVSASADGDPDPDEDGTYVGGFKRNGYFGIRETDPDAYLHVSAEADGTWLGGAGRVLIVSGPKPSTGAGTSGQIAVIDTTALAADNGGSITFGAEYSTGNDLAFATIGGFKENATSSNQQGYFSIWTRSASAMVEHFHIDSSGNTFMGDGGTTNYLEVEADGEVVFHGESRIKWTKITADSITLSAGTSSETVTDLQTSNDGNVYQLTEAAATPGQTLIIDFESVVAFNWVNCLATYEGSGTHALEIELYNWSTASWDHFQCIQNGYSNSGTIFGNESFFVPDDTNYIGTGGDAGNVRVRLNHPNAGNASHDTYIDVVALYH